VAGVEVTAVRTDGVNVDCDTGNFPGLCATLVLHALE